MAVSCLFYMHFLAVQEPFQEYRSIILQKTCFRSGTWAVCPGLEASLADQALQAEGLHVPGNGRLIAASRGVFLGGDLSFISLFLA